MISVDEWKKGLTAWKNVQNQANIDLEQAELIIPVIEKKIRELEGVQEVE